MRMRMHIPVAYYVALIFCLVTTSCKVANGLIGVTWGRQSYQRLIPSMVVDMILQNEVKHARIYSGQEDILNAFSGSGIDLTIGIYRPKEYADEATANKWVADRILRYYPRVNYSRVLIGNYIFKNNLENSAGREIGINTLSLIQKALNKVNHGEIKASLTFSIEELVVTNNSLPSDARFKPHLVPDIRRVLAILKENNSPFVVQIFPAQYANEHNKSLAFAFPDNNDPSLFIHDEFSGFTYKHVFEFIYDSFVWALRTEGEGDMPIIVDQACWATDGLEGANLTTAERFFRGLLPWARSDEGTPMRKGKPIDLYVHSLTDETIVSAKDEPWARHWGIYRSNGEPKYKLDLTGRNRDISPVMARGIMRMPKRWCVLKKDNNHDQQKLDYWENKICEAAADCTSLAEGGSCSRLSEHEKMSYRFNVYFQTHFQEEDSCVFDGLGEVTTLDPSNDNCKFTVEVVEGKQDNMKDSAHAHPSHLFFLLLISIFSAAALMLL